MVNLFRDSYLFEGVRRQQLQKSGDRSLGVTVGRELNMVKRCSLEGYATLSGSGSRDGNGVPGENFVPPVISRLCYNTARKEKEVQVPETFPTIGNLVL
jgi:hypothetical protein